LDAFIAAIASFITATISAFGYGGVIFLMALESACLPVPSEIVMPFSGFLASTGRFNLPLVATAGALGCSIGSTATYLAGAFGGRQFLERWGRYFFVDGSRLNRFESYFKRFGAITIFLARMLPMVPAFVSFPAGIARMPFGKFLIYTFCGTWLWCFALALAGFEFGKAWASNPLVRNAIHALDGAVLILVAAFIIWIAWRVLRSRN
jgi:membrane protein DedA with SNARE-associated domain